MAIVILLAIQTLTFSYSDLNTDTKEVSTSTTQLEQQKEGVVITSKDPTFTRTTRYDTAGNLYELSEYHADGRVFHCVKEGKTIKTSTQDNHRSVNCGEKKWIQDFFFGLKNFTLSNDKKLKYVTINPNDLKPVDMVITKKEIEVIEGRKTQKLHATLQGWKSMFWEAFVWIDAATGILVKMEGNRGPGTPTTIFTLTSEK